MSEKKREKENAYIAEHFDRLSIALPKGKKDQLRKLATDRHMSVTKLIVKMLDDELEKNGDS